MVESDSSSAMFFRPFVWLGTDNVILRVDVNTEKVVNVLSGHTRIIHRFVVFDAYNRY